MPKFYATCGSQSLVLDADTADQAAMRLVDEVMSAHIWIYEDADLSEQDRRDHLILEALLHLEAVISISERGGGRMEAGQFGVPEMLDQWHRLMSAISRALSSAGIAPGRALPEPTDSTPPSDRPAPR